MNEEKKLKLRDVVEECRKASFQLAKLKTSDKNKALNKMADLLVENKDEIIEANVVDLKEGRDNGLSEALLDRLKLNASRIKTMADALREISSFNDPVGEISNIKRRPSGIEVGEMRIPLGVIMMIYESRPNVTSDAAGLCLKAGNSIVLRGGKEAFNSNTVIAKQLRKGLQEVGINPAAVTLVPTTDREAMTKLLQFDELIDLVIPRGGEGLIRFVKDTSKIPVIMHYKGVCHIYIDKDADLEMAKQLTCEGKLSRPGVCNSLETMLVHRDVAEKFLSDTGKVLLENGAEIRGCEKTKAILPNITAVVEDDYYAEFLSKIIACKVVNSYDEARDHIQKYNSDHTDVIVTNNLKTARLFQQEINSSVVCVNASSRFSDGGELGLGAEIGISTSKLHAYGPMGIESLTTKKFIVTGDGNLRHGKIY